MSRPDPSDPADLVERLDALVRGLLAHGVSHPADLVASEDGRALTDLVFPAGSGAGSVHDRAIRTHRLIVAAVAALGRPAAPALEALLDLHPAARPAGRRPMLTRTERREQAGTYYRVAGDTIRRHHEPRLVRRLAMEIYQRARLGDLTTHGAPEHSRPRHAPAPPDQYRTGTPVPDAGRAPRERG
ncbi:hypothetical protein [Pseudofrankia asymbiotica]|uniref:Uncharacterized protein n=1 Tax=Pseudofrankia asymbiotica TaxID=1834516 RepID=A0A1V2I253_9ACTN|nr:hypothetical protein [Pseudofrankia asymbiotica]ONH24168.1 hypothetical protein BL253_30895 [Pseudofrankia asymbiotica]